MHPFRGNYWMMCSTILREKTKKEKDTQPKEKGIYRRVAKIVMRITMKGDHQEES